MLLINRARSLNGWGMKEFDQLEPTMLLWWETFTRYGIPVEAYRELFDLAFDERQIKIGRGEDAPMIEAALLVSCWTRPGGLKAEIEQRRIKAGNLLSETAMTTCSRCFGTGIENKFDIDGRVLGAILGRKCDHRAPAQGDGLWEYLEKAKQAVGPRAVK